MLSLIIRKMSLNLLVWPLCKNTITVFSDLHSAYFPDELDIALTVWNMYVIVGLAWQAGWSTSLCVSTKIYFQIGFLCFSIICYGKYIVFLTTCVVMAYEITRRQKEKSKSLGQTTCLPYCKLYYCYCGLYIRFYVLNNLAFQKLNPKPPAPISGVLNNCANGRSILCFPRKFFICPCVRNTA